MSVKEESDSEGGPEYEDDFEKDLDWLINEEEKKHTFSQNEDDNEHLTEQRPDNTTQLVKQENKGDSMQISGSDIAQAVPNMNGKLILDTVSESEEVDPEDEEAKRYIAGKIEEANKRLEMETVDEKRQRKLKFKDKLVDLEVPPLEFPDSDRTESITEEDVVDSITKLHLDEGPAKEQSNPEVNEKAGEEPKDGKVLVEKDGKFELVSLKDIENQCSLPPINNKDLSKSPSPSMESNRFGALHYGDNLDYKKTSTVGNVNHFVPQPPGEPKVRPSSATHSLKSIHKVKPSRRVQSASVSTRNTTFSLSPEQKELQKRIQERQERLRREEEERKQEEEEQKRKENEMAFKVWLQKKNEQLIQEKRIQQAKELEKGSTSDKEKEASKEAFTVWMKRKHREQLKEKKIEELRQQETVSFLEDRKDRKGAFVQWLKQKKIQKRVEQQAATDRSRRLLLEARRSKQIHNLLYNISESRSFRYIDPYS